VEITVKKMEEKKVKKIKGKEKEESITKRKKGLLLDAFGLKGIFEGHKSDH
jgi:hypothetical protein